ncbi:MAG: UDP-3-O-(3-hydroxymyristoyl)glucosamine N-acyltransferase [Pseudomonadota bacterium]
MQTTLQELAERLGAELRGDGAQVIRRVDTLERADAFAISFYTNRRYRAQLDATRAGAVLLTAADVELSPVPTLVLDNPYLGYARVAGWLNPAAPASPGVHPSAVVDPSAEIAADATVGPLAVIEADVRVGARAVVGPACVVGHRCRIGADTRLIARVTMLYDVQVGDRVTIHPGVVLGAQGFGIANDDGVWVNIPQLGNVIIGNDVDIGANTCIDRGALDDTRIEDGVKIDNHVQIGHNVQIGQHTAIAGCVAIAGSARIGARCTIGGTSAVSGHLEIADDVHLTGGTNVPNSIREAGVYSSTLPLQSNRDWRRNMARVKHLDELAKRVRRLEDSAGEEN